MRYILILSLLFFQFIIYRSIGFGDIVIMFFNFYILLNFKISYNIIRENFLLIIFFIWLCLTPILVSDYNSDFYLFRILRLANVLLAFIIIPIYFVNFENKFKNLINFNLRIVYIVCFLVLIEYIFLSSGFDLRLIRFEDRVANRLYLFFSEPSILALYLTLSTLFLSYCHRSGLVKFNLFFLISASCISIFSLLSFTGLFGIFLIITYNLFSLFNIRNVLILAILFLLGFNYVTKTAFFSKYFERFESATALDDNSSTQRLIGAWNVSRSLVDNLYFGVGTGQEADLKNKKFRSIEYFSDFNKKINNSYAVILYENGIVGLAIFILFTLSFLKSSKLTAVVIIYYFFSHGGYFFSFFWVFMLLFKSVSFIKIKKAKNLSLSKQF